jgi:hypothetical protein
MQIFYNKISTKEAHMNNGDFVRMLMEKHGIHLEPSRAEFMTGPTGLFNLLVAIRTEIFKRDVSGFTPNDDLDFSRGGVNRE